MRSVTNVSFSGKEEGGGKRLRPRWSVFRNRKQTWKRGRCKTPLGQDAF